MAQHHLKLDESAKMRGYLTYLRERDEAELHILFSTGLAAPVLALIRQNRRTLCIGVLPTDNEVDLFRNNQMRVLDLLRYRQTALWEQFTKEAESSDVSRY